MPTTVLPKWWPRWARWLGPPILETEERTQRAGAFWRVASGTFIIWTAGLIILVLQHPDTLGWRAATAAMVWGVVLPLLELNRRGWTGTASWCLVLGLTALTSQRAWNLGGLHGPLGPFFVLFVMLAG